MLFLNPSDSQQRFRIERFHSRDQRPYWFTETKENICKKKKSLIPGGLVWYTNMAAASLFLNTNMAVNDSNMQNNFTDTLLSNL